MSADAETREYLLKAGAVKALALYEAAIALDDNLPREGHQLRDVLNRAAGANRKCDIKQLVKQAERFMMLNADDFNGNSAAAGLANALTIIEHYTSIQAGQAAAARQLLEAGLFGARPK